MPEKGAYGKILSVHRRIFHILQIRSAGIQWDEGRQFFCCKYSQDRRQAIINACSDNGSQGDCYNR